MILQSAKREAAKLEGAEKKRLEKEIKKTEALAKKAQNEEIKRIEAIIKIEKKVERIIKNAAEKKRNLKCKGVLVSTSGPSKNKIKKKLNNLLVKTLAKKADTANNQS